MGATMQWLWEYIFHKNALMYSFPPLQSGLRRFQNAILAALRRGKIPKHVAIIMDGNRRWARSVRIDTAEGHYSGAETLKNVFHFLPYLFVVYLNCCCW
jgi:undecaprenyl pyrophosphate synthase